MLSRLFRSLNQPMNALEGLEPRSLLSADFAITVGTLKEGFDRAGNQTLKLPVTVASLGSLNVMGGGSIDYFLSTDRTLDDQDFKFASTALPKVKPGSAGTITLDTMKPALVAPPNGRPVPTGDYFVIAHLVTKSGADSNSSNDTAVASPHININYLFGQIGDKSNIPLTATLSNGTTVVFSLRGQGQGQVVNADGKIFVIVQGTTTQSSIQIAPTKGTRGATLAGITINGSLKDFHAVRISVDGNVTINGTLGMLELGNLAHSTFRINGIGRDLGIALGQVTDSTLFSRTPLRSVSVDRWRDTDATADELAAPYIDKLSSKGNFEAGVSTTVSHKGFSIMQLGVGGHISGNWSIRGAINNMEVGSIASAFGGTVNGNISTLRVRGNAGGSLGVGNINRFIVGGNMTGATYLAGANLGADGKLDGDVEGDDTFTTGRFGLIEIRGKMINSTIGAGLRTDDAIIGNADDQLSSSGQIDTIIVKHGMTSSHFVAAHMPKKANVNFRDITTAGNPSFISG
jgi:hypothetical protein